MRIFAHSTIRRDKSSRIAGQQAAQAVLAAAGAQPLAVVLVYATVDHDQEALLAAAREVLGSTPLLGCSTAGLMGRGSFFEGNYAAGMLALGGAALTANTAAVLDYHIDTIAKARALGQQLLAGLREPPRIVVLHADSLCGADLESFARAVQDEVGCPVVGSGAGQPWGTMVQTFQYRDADVHSRAAVAVALAGEFTVEIATTTGTEPTLSSAVVTRAEGNVLLELDGRPALDMFSDFVGKGPLTGLDSDTNVAVALGIELAAPAETSGLQSPYVVRGPFAVDPARGGLIMPATVPEGTRIVFHRRSIPAALAGAEQTAHALARRLAGRTVRAVLGLECAARTGPLLGRAETTREQLLVQQIVAPDAEWLGMLAWGELAPFAGRVTYYNFTYPIIVLAE